MSFFRKNSKGFILFVRSLNKNVKRTNDNVWNPVASWSFHWTTLNSFMILLCAFLARADIQCTVHSPKLVRWSCVCRDASFINRRYNAARNTNIDTIFLCSPPNCCHAAKMNPCCSLEFSYRIYDQHEMKHANKTCSNVYFVNFGMWSLKQWPFIIESKFFRKKK